ncbi:thiamine pyrophosphate-dependent enzyme [Achromobacter spanius]|uniref:Thiamine pyrophosphate-dependent enzyme n=1 Tax=Achromobacter spanius TaxID=217203 RepID=A0AA42LRG4_9BURK|nr:thiamine pyrophosphate-dependent enzyme [Achromobacter spanius]MDH0738118.1 thiamine pyrophosphate-dependent enzyme [Achromobacter spanius]
MNASATMNRRAAVARILEQRGNALVVASLGNPTYDTSAAGDDDRNFYVWGAMGGACMAALGLALAQPRRQVLAFVGDGEMLMGMGSLATIGVRAPSNLKIIVIDNEHYGETGMQPAHSGRGVDIAGIARACGIADSVTLRSGLELDERISGLYQPGLQCVVLKVAAAPEASSLPPRDGPYLRSRFREAVLGKGKGGHA